MALFSDDSSSAHHRHEWSLRERIGWGSVTVAVVIGLVFAVMPSPYVIEAPGPVYDTLGSAENADGDEVPLIHIPGETTYPTDGELNLLTVSVFGKPGNTPSWIEVMTAWFDRTRSVMPIEAVFPPGVSNSDRDAQNQAAMVDSQQDAIAAALVELGYDFPREVTVVSLLDDSPAAGVIEPDDVIVSLDGTPVHSIGELQQAVGEHGTDDPAEIVIERDGEQQTVEVTPVDNGGTPVLGVGVRMHYEFPVDVELQLDNVGGPSAGMMFALGIVDELTPGAMTGGEVVAGTGTIDSAGRVGPIGGIRQKLWGAEGAGADWFLAPESNCDEVVGHVPDGLNVFAVSTLDQARTIVEDLADGEVTGSYPSCDAS
ncbi:PDZ domain-containing protein [Agromyces sp. H3Y2-19a]|uniref:YlbL family protein n=1 Tax=Agromyces chromiiresistens TaxID=3030835 RepID=UPI0023B9DE8E|nr:PDZ domain-containing protein [Agromyces chromiiresistens]MDF0513049.1 PDZ domain-containing protein [Agromyces chromiiresistens]